MNEKKKGLIKRAIDYFLPDIFDVSISFIINLVGNSIKDRILRAIIIGILSALGNFFFTGNQNLSIQNFIPSVFHSITHK